MHSQEAAKAVVRTLLDAGAPLDQVNGNGSSALHYAAHCGFEGVVHMLVGARAALDLTKYDSGDTALMLAAQTGHEAIVRALEAAARSG